MMPRTPGGTLVIHMGLPKTGTTFLQNSVFSPSRQIADFGKTPSYRNDRSHVYAALKVVASAPDEEFTAQLPRLKALLLDEAAQAVGRKPEASCRLLSYEGFFHPHSIHPAEIHDRLVRIFGEFHILITIRHQFAWIASYYLYKFYRFLQGGGPSFEVWTRRVRKHPAWNAFVCCDYWRVIEPLIQQVGRERIRVEPMEAIIEAADEGALKRLADFLAVDVDAFSRLFAEGAPTKQRIDELGVLLGRVVYETRAADLSPDELVQLKRLFSKLHTQRRHKYDKASVPYEVIERCFSERERASIREGNTALSQHFKVDLPRFGYPVLDPEPSGSVGVFEVT